MSGRLAAAPRIVVLTGPGLLAGCGIADPDTAALTQRHNEDRRALQAPGVAPNAAHRALARLDAACPGEVLIATSTVDDLHERAGARAVVHLRGELLMARCGACRAVTLWYDDITGDDSCPRCAIPGQLGPHLVQPGEPLLGIAMVAAAAVQCRILATIGLTGAAPVPEAIAAAVAAGARVDVLDRLGPPEAVVPPYVERLIAEAAAGDTSRNG